MTLFLQNNTKKTGPGGSTEAGEPDCTTAGKVNRLLNMWWVKKHQLERPIDGFTSVCCRNDTCGLKNF